MGSFRVEVVSARHAPLLVLTATLFNNLPERRRRSWLFKEMVREMNSGVIEA